ncbi:hypothetical protein ACGFX4_20335 [Kitasatospora sp. NPDC048365]|uniref:hypothetical protein n=1 Tax=Kitasatospora sp. NPDC048365 TaxID=3364050 RepID=UPI00371285BE
MSSDRHPVEETPTERLLREALTARANQVTVHSLRQAAPPKTKLRKLKPVYAVTVPLFALAAASAGFYTIHGTPTAAKRDNGPAASVSATASPTGDMQIPAEPSASPSMTITPGGVPAIPQDYQSTALSVTVDGLAKGATLTAGADPLVFKVTFTNTTEVSFPKLVPGLGEWGAPSPCAAGNQFQVETGSGWKDAMGTGLALDQAQRGNGAFAIGPGESHTVRYRLKLDGSHPAGAVQIGVLLGGVTDDSPNGQPAKAVRIVGELTVDTTVAAATPAGAGSACAQGGATPPQSATATTQASQPAASPSTSAGPSSTASATPSPTGTAAAGH